MVNRIGITFLFLLCILGMAISQSEIEPGSSILVKMRDGNQYQGILIDHSQEELVIKTEKLGELTLEKGAIKRVVPLNINIGEQQAYIFENPNATRYIFAPSGYSLRKGEGYYQNFMVLYNSASYGITNNITIGFGLSPVIIDDFVPITITPKISFPLIEEKFNVGLGAMYIRINDEQVGIAYGVGTLGTRDKNVSIGMGWGYVDDEFSNRPVITLSGTWRIGKKWGIVTENWLIPDYSYSWDGVGEKSYLPIYSYSARFIGEFLSIDFGFLNQREIAEVFPLGVPIVGIVIPFGKPYACRKMKWN